MGKSKQGERVIAIVMAVLVAVACVNIGALFDAAVARTNANEIKPRWIKNGNKKVAYVKKNGEFAKGPTKIGKKLYLFNESGKLALQKREKKVGYKGDYYDVRKNGTLRKGWQVFNNKLYYFGGSNAAMITGKTVKKIRLQKDGTAMMTLDAATRIKSIKILNLLGVRDKSKKKQLKAAFRYVADKKKRFRYVSMNETVPRHNNKWVKKYANYMLTNRGGNCYRYACAFAALAYQIGYEPRVAVGKVNGPHSVVIIKNRYYDLTFHASMANKNAADAKYYGHKGGIKYSHTKYKKYYSHKYSACDGTAKTGKYDYLISKNEKRIKSDLVKKNGKVFYYNSKGKKTVPKSKVIFCNDKYYYFNKKGVSAKGIYFKGTRLYKQDKECDKYGYYMTETAFKSLQKKIKTGAPYKNLEKVIGPGEAGELSDSCYKEGGYDRIYKYPNFEVSVFCPEDGGDEIITAVY